MLSSFSWNIFFTTVTLLAGGYYAISALLLYRGEITFWFKSKSGSTGLPTKPVVKSAPVRPEPSGVMGGVALNDGRSELRSTSVSADDFLFASEDEPFNDIEQVPEVALKDEVVIGTIADLLEEIKTVSKLISETKSDGAEAESLMRTLLGRYPSIASGSFRDAVTLYLCKELSDRCAITVSLSDTEGWWDEESPNKK